MLTILETERQVEWYVENRREVDSNSSVLALTATAAYACQERSLPYLNLEDHCEYAKRFVEYEEILRDYLDWETWLDDWAHDNVPEFHSTGFRPAHAVTFFLQFLLAEIWATTTNLRELLASIRPTKIAYWSPRTIQVPWWLHPTVGPATVLLKDVAGANVELLDLTRTVSDLSPQPPEPATPPLRTFLSNRIKGYLRESNLVSRAETVKRFGLRPFLAGSARNGARILVSGSGYDLEPLILNLYASGARLSRLRDNLRLMEAGSKVGSQLLRKQLSSAWPKLLEEAGLWKPLDKRGIPRTELLTTALNFWWHQSVPILWNRYQQVSRTIARKKITALITVDAGATMWGGPSCQAAFAAGIPRFMLQHGGSIGADSCIWQMFLRSSDAFLVGGDGIAQDLERTSPSFLSPILPIVSVGASRLDKIRERNSPDRISKLRAALRGDDPRPIILYVPTVFGTYARCISDVAGLPDTSYLELLERVLGLWKETPDVRLLYKDFNVVSDSTRVMPGFIARNIPNGEVTTRRLSDLVWAVDAIIVDHAVTALTEVLLTKKPVIVYVPRPNKATTEAKALLRKRATVAETPEEFISTVRSFLARRDFSELTAPNDEFLRMYGTHKDDGQSAARAAEVILQWPGVAPTKIMTGKARRRPNLTQSKQPSSSDSR